MVNTNFTLMGEKSMKESHDYDNMVVSPQRSTQAKSGVQNVEDKMAIDKNSVIPIYYQLAKFLENQIRQGKFQPGEALPTEMELAERFQISRMTVRKAIGELVAKGMVYTKQGKGTFVSAPKLDDVVFELDAFIKGAEERGLSFQTTLLEAKIVRADAQLKAKFQTDDDSLRFLYFVMVLTAEGEPLAYERKYTIYTKRKPILETELQEPSLTKIVSQHTDQMPISSKKVLQVSVATEKEAAILQIAPGAPVFVLEQTLYNSEGKPIGWSKSVYRGDRYQLTAYDGWHGEEE